MGGTLSELYHDYHEQANFLCIYLSEAHPADRWSLGATFSSMTEHVTLKQRMDAARCVLSYIRNDGLYWPQLHSRFHSRFSLGLISQNGQLEHYCQSCKGKLRSNFRLVREVGTVFGSETLSTVSLIPDTILPV